MALGKRSADWDYTCAIVATLFNTRWGAKHPVKAQDLHPLNRPAKNQPLKVSIRDLRHVLMGK